MADVAEAPRPCATCATLAPSCEHRFKVETSVYLPDCLLCGRKAARCGCPREFVAPQPEPPPVDPRSAALSARVLGADHRDPARVRREIRALEHRIAAERARPAAPARPLPPDPHPRPWCPGHGWEAQEGCEGCGCPPPGARPLLSTAWLLPDKGVIREKELRAWRKDGR